MWFLVLVLAGFDKHNLVRGLGVEGYLFSSRVWVYGRRLYVFTQDV